MQIQFNFAVIIVYVNSESNKRPEKVLFPLEITKEGIVICVIDKNLEKAKAPIEVIEEIKNCSLNL